MQSRTMVLPQNLSKVCRTVEVRGAAMENEAKGGGRDREEGNMERTQRFEVSAVIVLCTLS